MKYRLKTDPRAASRPFSVRVQSVAGTARTVRDVVAVEAPLEIRFRGRSVAVTMRTPGHDRELAAGFLLTERILRERKDLVAIRTCRASLEPDNTVDVFLKAGVEVDFARLTRHFFATSSCGQCGKASLDAVKQHFPPVNSQITVAAATLARLPGRMRRAQPTFARTGGLHAAALFDARGRLLVLREDVGRHNAVDKVVGRMLLAGQLPAGALGLFVSGRASFELVAKAWAAGFAAMVSVSAPTALAVETARRAGLLLAGFGRGTALNVYAPERLPAS